MISTSSTSSSSFLLLFCRFQRRVRAKRKENGQLINFDLSSSSSLSSSHLLNDASSFTSNKKRGGRGGRFTGAPAARTDPAAAAAAAASPTSTASGVLSNSDYFHTVVLHDPPPGTSSKRVRPNVRSTELARFELNDKKMLSEAKLNEITSRRRKQRSRADDDDGTGSGGIAALWRETRKEREVGGDGVRISHDKEQSASKRRGTSACSSLYHHLIVL